MQLNCYQIIFYSCMIRSPIIYHKRVIKGSPNKTTYLPAKYSPGCGEGGKGVLTGICFLKTGHWPMIKQMPLDVHCKQLH